MIMAFIIYISVLLSSLFLISRYITIRRKPLTHQSPFPDKLLYGLSYGLSGVCIMFLHKVVEGSVHFDLRQILILLPFFYGGWIPALFSAVVISVYRFFLLGGGIPFLLFFLGFLTTLGIAQIIVWSNIPRSKQWYLITVICMMEIYTSLWMRLHFTSYFDSAFFRFGGAFIVGALLAYHFKESFRHSHELWVELRQSKEELQQTVASLKKTTEQLESFIQHSADPIVILDNQDHVIKVNPAFEQVFGWSQEEVVGTIPPYVPSSKMEEVQEVRRKVHSGQNVSGYDSIRVRKDGSHCLVNLTVSPIRDAKGVVVGYSSVFRDITQQKTLEAALIQSEANYRLIAEHSSDLIAVLNINGNSLYLSPSHMHVLGLPPEENLGKRASERIHPDDFPSVFELWSEAIMDHKGSHCEYRFLHDNGEWVWLESHYVPILEESGEIDKVLVISRDVTERKQTEELYRDTEKLSVVGELAAGIAHEIRNPLTTLKGFIQLMKKDASTYQPFFLDVMYDELDRIDLITNELLYLAKPQIQEIKQTNIKGMLEQITTLLNPQALLHNIILTVKSEDNLPSLTCVENRLKQVFINLVKNAMEAMPNGGEIVLAAKREEKTLYLSVKDQGIGIPEDRIAKLGQPFYSLKEKGTGLGLTVCKKIIQEHNGCLTFHSELGIGTTVEVRLPLSAESTGKKLMVEVRDSTS
jgi:two-component system, sporulation sensor kinase A